MLNIPDNSNNGWSNYGEGNTLQIPSVKSLCPKEIEMYYPQNSIANKNSADMNRYDKVIFSKYIWNPNPFPFTIFKFLQFFP
jgi:hypothetical protein